MQISPEKIKHFRKENGWSQEVLAKASGLSLRTIQRIESTEVTPRSYTLKLIFKALDFDGFSSSNTNSSTTYENPKNSKINITKKQEKPK